MALTVAVQGIFSRHHKVAFRRLFHTILFSIRIFFQNNFYFVDLLQKLPQQEFPLKIIKIRYTSLLTLTFVHIADKSNVHRFCRIFFSEFKIERNGYLPRSLQLVTNFITCFKAILWNLQNTLSTSKYFFNIKKT